MAAAMEAMHAEHVEGVENDAAALGPLPLMALEAHGCASSDLKKLLDSGIYTVQGLVAAPLKKLVLIKGLSEVKAKKLKDAGAPTTQRRRRRARGLTCAARSAKNLVPDGFTTATAIEHKRRNTVYITTGCADLDTLLQGAGGEPACEEPFCVGRSLTAPQAAWRRAPSPRFTASFARARRSCATCWPSPARRAAEGAPASRRACAQTLTPLSPAAARQRRRRGQGAVHRHRRHLPPGAPGCHC